jgi:hypothetical protein
LPAKLIDHQNRVVSAEEIDRYLDALTEPKRATLARLRQMILDIVPEADLIGGPPPWNRRTTSGAAGRETHRGAAGASLSG